MQGMLLFQWFLLSQAELFTEKGNSKFDFYRFGQFLALTRKCVIEKSLQAALSHCLQAFLLLFCGIIS